MLFKIFHFMKKKKISPFKSLFFFIFLFSFFNNFLDSSVYAASPQYPDLGMKGNAIVKVLCNIIDLLTGGIAKGVAMIAIVVVAVGLFMGKFSWGVGLATAIGIAMIFGAATVVDWLANGIGDIKDLNNSCNF
jgi:type IV secretory pathway VirB2 component (pilin)